MNLSGFKADKIIKQHFNERKLFNILLYFIAFYALKTGKLIFLQKSNLIFYPSWSIICLI